MLDLPLAALPDTLADAAARARDDLCEADSAGAVHAAFAGDEGRRGELARVLACSPWAAAQCARRPALLAELAASGELWQRLPEDAWERAQIGRAHV